jgi:hypothetical protein
LRPRLLLILAIVPACGAQSPLLQRLSLPADPPPGAVVLFDGKSLDHWIEYHDYLSDFKPQSARFDHYRVVDDVIFTDITNPPADKQCYLATKESFGDVRLHLEFRVPYTPEKHGQDRGNSGVYLQGRYEIQILDSYRDPPALDGNGAIYGLFPPLINAARQPGEWQTYDVWFRAPRFRGSEVTEKPRITVFENGVLIQDDRELNVVSTQRYTPARFVPTGPVVLQNHWCPVRFRNIWVQEGARYSDRPTVPAAAP